MILAILFGTVIKGGPYEPKLKSYRENSEIQSKKHKFACGLFQEYPHLEYSIKVSTDSCFLSCLFFLCDARATRVVGRGFLRSCNLVNILYIYLILAGVTIKNNAKKHTEGNLAILFISKDLASQKPQYNGNLRKSTVKRKSLTTCTKLHIGIKFS